MHTGFLRTLRAYGDVLEKWATSIALISITTLIFTSVVLRYLFSSGIVWGEEMSRALFICMTYLAISRADKAGLHFRVTLLQERFPKVRPYVETFVDVVQVLLLVYLTYLAVRLVIFVADMGQRLPASDLPSYLFYLPIAIGLGLGAIRSVGQFLSRSSAALRR